MTNFPQFESFPIRRYNILTPEETLWPGAVTTPSP